MTQGLYTFFRWDRTRLLRRTKKVEYWEGEVNGHPAIIKRFPDKSEFHWREYILQSRIRHPLVLPTGEAGIGSGGRFSYSLQLDFIPTKLEQINDTASFAAQILALAASLEKKGFDFRWDPGLILQDTTQGRPVLAGLGPIRSRTPRDLASRAPRVLAELRQAIALHGGSDPSVEKTIRKWERRKDKALAGCLQDLMASHKIFPEILPTWFEIARTRELELITGLLQLAKQSCGRSVLFLSDYGEGKSTLLSEIARDLLLRQVETIVFRAAPENRPYHSIRRLLDQFYEQTGAYQELREEMSTARRLRDSGESLAIPEEALLTEFQRVVAALRGSHSDRTFVLLIDDLDAFDSQSLRVFGLLLRNLHSIPLLIVATSTRPLEGLPEQLVVLSLEAPPVSDFEDCCVVPLWKPEQRRLIFQNIHSRTSGNMLLFQETLHETLRQNAQSIRWGGGEWSLENCAAPVLPDSAAQLYLRKSPPLSAEETAFLEAASVQGGAFDSHLLDLDNSDSLLASLREKGILVEVESRCRFRRTVVADFLYQRMDSGLKKARHLQLAEKWSASGDRKRESEIARHYLKAGRLPESLDHACRASARIRFNTPQLILPILEELERKEERLNNAQKLQLYREKAELLFRRGRYPAACDSLQRALPLSADDAKLRFDLSVRIAESQFLNNDILAAQTTLKEAERDLGSVTNPGIIIRFYFCRGACSWHRGQRERSDFERALALAEEHHDYESLACGYRQLAELALRGGVLQEARTLAGRALKFARRTRSRVESGHALRLLGTIAWHRSLHRTAEKVLNHSIRHFTSAGSLDGVARVWSILGNVCVEQYRFSDAISAFQKASELYSQLDHPLEVSLAQFNLGLVYVEQGRLKEAEKIYLRCRALDRKTGNKRYYAYDLRALAVISILRGFHRKATRLLQRVLEICSELHADGDILQTRMILLMNELEQKNYRQAKPIAEWLEGRLSSVEEPMATAEIHYLLGHYYGYINEGAKAEKHLQEALRISRRIHYYKLMGMCLILKLTFAPAALRARIPNCFAESPRSAKARMNCDCSITY